MRAARDTLFRHVHFLVRLSAQNLLLMSLNWSMKRSLQMAAAVSNFLFSFLFIFNRFYFIF
jgi:hypothetical protein